jgi:hypothetical protein
MGFLILEDIASCLWVLKQYAAMTEAALEQLEDLLLVYSQQMMLLLSDNGLLTLCWWSIRIKSSRVHETSIEWQSSQHDAGQHVHAVWHL